MDSARLASKEGGLSRGTGGLMTQATRGSSSSGRVLVGVGLRIPNSGVVACEDKLDEVTKQKRLFFLLFGYRIHCIFEE